MKTTIAAVTLFTSILGARLTAAEPSPVVPSVEQLFQEADIQLAIEQYKKIRMAAFDLGLKLQTESTLTTEQRKLLEIRRSELQDSAEQLRAVTIKKALVAGENPK